MRAGNVFHNQCEHWWKHFLQSASRPEIPKNFRLVQRFFPR